MTVINLFTKEIITEENWVGPKTAPIKTKAKKSKSKSKYQLAMQDIAQKCCLCYDGDDRLHYDKEFISVAVSIMTRDEYADIEAFIAKTEIKGKGYVVYAWNDVGGYDYWNKDDESNYIQITVAITTKKLGSLNLEHLAHDADKLYDMMSQFDNMSQYYATKETAHE